jgi:flagellar basal-body rod protein FlgF
MNVSAYQASAALTAQSQWLEVISNNLASASVPGFKKQEVSFESVQDQMGGADSLIPRATVATNFQPGPLRPTGDPHDFAIDGPGFFEVQLPNGTAGFTRDGEFTVNAQGQLVTKAGYPVLDSGAPIQMDPANTRPISVSATGEISQGNQAVGRLGLVEFSNTAQLQPAGAGLFVPSSGAQPTPASRSTIRQGFIEASNVTSASEMVRMISAMRQFEANQRVVQSQDERLGKAIATLGNMS